MANEEWHAVLSSLRDDTAPADPGLTEQNEADFNT